MNNAHTFFTERKSQRKSEISREKEMKYYPNKFSMFLLLLLTLSAFQLYNSTFIIKKQDNTTENKLKSSETIRKNKDKFERKEKTWAIYEDSLHFSQKGENTEIRSVIEEDTESDSNSSISLFEPISNALISKRFPKFGTKEFSKRCSWAEDIKFREGEETCFFMVKPTSTSSEGISDWVPLIVIANLLAIQSGCRLIISYVPNVDILEVIIPHNITPSTSGNASESRGVSWITEPENFNCIETNRCKHVKSRGCAWRHKEAFGEKLANVPYYRYPYAEFQVNNSNSFVGLEKAIEGFELESGMACSFESLIQLSPKAARYEPKLFSDILPALRDQEALVISVYIRTGHTDRVAANSDGSENKQFHQNEADHVLRCVIDVENQFLLEFLNQNVKISQVVWMVVTDSQFVKEMVTKNYDGRLTLNSTSNLSSEMGTFDKFLGQNIHRKVITTNSRGAHTRTSGNPSTADFVEGMIDWYLIGESDVVVGRGPSFHVTGALRTARPFYRDHCIRPDLFK